MDFVPAPQIVPRTKPAIRSQSDHDRAETLDAGRVPQERGESARAGVSPARALQAPMTDQALFAGLEVLSRALVRRLPGRRFIFEATPRCDHARIVDGGEVVGRMAAPKDPDAALVDRDRLRPTRTADVPHEPAADHRA
jgi:hypothetical protein